MPQSTAPGRALRLIVVRSLDWLAEWGELARVAEQLDVRLPASSLYELLAIRSLSEYLPAHEGERLRGDNPSITTGERTHR